MSSMHGEYWMDVFRLEHEQRLRAAAMRRAAAPVHAPSRLRTRFGSALVRLGLLVGGPALARSRGLVPAHGGGAVR